MKLVSNKTAAKRLQILITVKEADDPTTYDGVLDDSLALPDYTFVELVSEDDVKTVKLTEAGSVWSTAIPLTTSEGDAAEALASKAEIVALTAVDTADGSDPTTTQALANALKVKVNAIIAALKA